MANVLIAEDDELVRNTIRRFLRLNQHDIIACQDGQEARDWLDQNHPLDLLITDLRMPRMDGLSLIRHLRAQRPSVPIIVLSGYVTDGMASELADLPACHLLAKPFQLAALTAALDQALAPAP
ncbi:MAG: response regulator [Candidatus Marinimicrobia bacterium]|nr:response regulator [Candidatus Neomarinimicrobiota bacterium]